MQSSSTQGCHLSCHSESPCQQPGCHPKRKSSATSATIAGTASLCALEFDNRTSHVDFTDHRH